MSDVELRDLFAAHALGGLVAHGRLANLADKRAKDVMSNSESAATAIAILCQDAAAIGEQMLRTVRPKATGEKIASKSLQQMADEANR